MNDDIKLPPMPSIQVPRIEADVSMLDIKVLARWCERIATEYASAALKKEREAHAETKRAMTEALLVMEERAQRDEALLRQALDALIWTTGSGDFSEDGQAREGAVKLLFPTIAALRERLA